MELFIASFLIISFAFVAIGVGVLFFGKTASREACGKVPGLNLDVCPSQEAGICPMEDRSGALKMQRMTRLNYSTLKKEL
jgi:hypothetical protein